MGPADRLVMLYIRTPMLHPIQLFRYFPPKIQNLHCHNIMLAEGGGDGRERGLETAYFLHDNPIMISLTMFLLLVRNGGVQDPDA